MNSRRVRATQDYCHGTKRKPCKLNKLHYIYYRKGFGAHGMKTCWDFSGGGGGST